MLKHLRLLALAVALLGGPGVVRADLSGEDTTAVMTQALQWALDGGLATAATLPPKAIIYVVETNVPRGAVLKLKSREVKVVPYVRMQAFADITSEVSAFLFDRVRERDQRVVVSLALKPFASLKHVHTPLPPHGAELELERSESGWKVAKVVQRWP